MPDEQTTTLPDSIQKKRHKFALAAFILGIVSIVILFLQPCAIAALVLGSIAIHQVNKDPEHLRGKGLAIVGVATGGTSVFFGMPLLIAIIIPTVVNAPAPQSRPVNDSKIERADAETTPLRQAYVRSTRPVFILSADPGKRVVAFVPCHSGQKGYSVRSA